MKSTDSAAAGERQRWQSVQESYDTIAAEYAKRIYPELKDKPFDRDWLDRFAERVRAIGPVCDLGCGPGHVARYLRDRGVDVFGLDISPAMVREASRLNPGIQFVEGNMVSLKMKPEALGGIVSFYSIIHLDRGELFKAMAEMRRVLRPNGCALVAFHQGSETIHSAELWGHTVNLDATFFTTLEIIGQLERAGFQIEAEAERDLYPEVEYQSRRSYILATKRPPTSTRSTDK
jgi:SAM-dependent methyltransferase